MLALPQEYTGAMCELKSMDDYPVSVGRVIEIDHDAIGIAALEGERIPLLQYRRRMKLLVRKGDMFTIMVGIVYLSTNTFVRFEEVVTFEASEQRNAFRVRTKTEAVLYPVLEENDEDEDEEPKEVPSIPVEVIDLSLTGARVLSEQTLHKNMDYQLEMKLMGTKMEFLIRVQREVVNQGHRHQYGCSFEKMSDRQSDNLCNKLFELQRIERTRRRERSVAL